MVAKDGAEQFENLADENRYVLVLELVFPVRLLAQEFRQVIALVLFEELSCKFSPELLNFAHRPLLVGLHVVVEGVWGF